MKNFKIGSRELGIFPFKAKTSKIRRKNKHYCKIKQKDSHFYNNFQK